MDGILDDISDSLGIGCAIKKLVSIPNGLAIQKLEDLFDHCTLFIAMTSTKAKLTPQDLQVKFRGTILWIFFVHVMVTGFKFKF